MENSSPDLRSYSDFVVTGSFAHPAYYKDRGDWSDEEEKAWRGTELSGGDDDPHPGDPKFAEERRIAGATHRLGSTVRAKLMALTVGDGVLAKNAERRLHGWPSDRRR